MDAERRTARVTLILSLGSDPIAGRVLREDGSSQRFTGWLALVRAVEEALAAVRGDPPDERRQG